MILSTDVVCSLLYIMFIISRNHKLFDNLICPLIQWYVNVICMILSGAQFLSLVFHNTFVYQLEIYLQYVWHACTCIHLLSKQYFKLYFNSLLKLLSLVKNILIFFTDYCWRLLTDTSIMGTAKVAVVTTRGRGRPKKNNTVKVDEGRSWDGMYICITIMGYIPIPLPRLNLYLSRTTCHVILVVAYLLRLMCLFADLKMEYLIPIMTNF